MNIKNNSQLRKVLMGKCATAIENAEVKVYGEFFDNVHQFYTEYEPDEYIRTYALYNSLDSTGVKRTGNQHGSYVKAKVYFNTPNYEHGMMTLQHTPEHGMYGWSGHSDEEVLDIVMTNSKPHGEYAKGTAIWNKSMKNLGGKKGIENLIKQELKKQGL